MACHIKHIHNNTHTLKYCNNPADYSYYYHAFFLEYHTMRELEYKYKEAYTRYFPQYLLCSDDSGTSSNVPFLLMEKISGNTLEDILATSNDWNVTAPSLRLEPWKVKALFNQLLEALTILYDKKNGLFLFDLSPQNIIITENTDTSFKIKLIDFTNCLHVNPDRFNYAQLYHIRAKLMDGKLFDVYQYPHAFSIKTTFMLLFTRLFYSGVNGYKQFHLADKDTKEFFLNLPFGTLLSCLFADHITNMEHAHEIENNPTYTTSIDATKDWCNDLIEKVLPRIE